MPIRDSAIVRPARLTPEPRAVLLRGEPSDALATWRRTARARQRAPIRSNEPFVLDLADSAAGIAREVGRAAPGSPTTRSRARAVAKSDPNRPRARSGARYRHGVMPSSCISIRFNMALHLVDLLASTKAPRRSGAGPTATWCRPAMPAPRAGTRGVSRPSAWRGARVIVRDLHRAGALMEPVRRRLLGPGVTVWSARARTARSSAASSAAPKPARRRGGMTYMRLISPMPGAMVRNLAPATGWSPSSPMREMPSGGRRSAISIGTPGSAPDIPESSATISANRLRAGSVQRHRHKRRCAGRASPSEATARRPNARRARSGDTRQVARCSSSNQTDLPARSESTPQAADRHSTSCRPLPAVSLGPVSRSSGRR